MSPTGLWAVQVGSFAERQRADRHADRVRAAGFPVYLEPYAGPDARQGGAGRLARRRRRDSSRILEHAGFEGIVVAERRLPTAGAP